MRNVLKVYGRDLRRIGRAPKTWAILIGLIIVPSLYAWVNIVAFWDPYGSTQDVKVAVVNQDEGASNAIAGEVNVGEQIVAQLEKNDQLGWQFLAYDKAMHDLKAGDIYAAIVIPRNFSKDLLTITTGDFVQPKLQYFTNQKANAIAPKITDAGATGVDTQVNATFVQTVAQKVAEQAEGLGDKAGEQMLGARDDALVELDDAVAKVARSRDGLTDLRSTLAAGSEAAADAKAALGDVDDTLGDVQSSVDQAQSLLTEVQGDLLTFNDAILNAYSSGTASIFSAAGTINTALDKAHTGAEAANRALTGAQNDVQAALEVNNAVLAQVRSIAAGLPDGDPVKAALERTIAGLERQGDADVALLATLASTQERLTAITNDVSNAADQMVAQFDRTRDAADALRTTMSNTVPAMNHALSRLSSNIGALSSALDSQRVLVGQTVDLLTGLEQQLAATGDPLDSLDANLASVQGDLSTLRNDLAAVSSAELWKQASALSSLDPERIAKFLSGPVQVHEVDMFRVPYYGSAMAPLFTNLALWIGAFMLVVLLRQEVDTEGVHGLTVRQAYLGRWMLVATMSVLQAVLVGVGDIVIGVQNVNPFAYVATVVFIGLVYVSIIFALAVSFGYIGKGLIIVLVVMQIPGGSGLYPIEMLPGFFRALFPIFPFTYGIDAMREVIAGFYGLYYWKYLAVLALFAALAFVLGIFVRRRLGNTARLFNDNLRRAGLFVIEDVRILGSRRRLDQVVRALTDRDKFMADTARRKRWYEQRHTTVLRSILAAGGVLTVVLIILGNVYPDSKATFLGLWALVCLFVIGSFVAVEYFRQNILHAGEVGEMADHELRAALADEEALIAPGTELDRIGEVRP